MRVDLLGVTAAPGPPSRGLAALQDASQREELASLLRVPRQRELIEWLRGQSSPAAREAADVIETIAPPPDGLIARLKSEYRGSGELLGMLP